MKRYLFLNRLVPCLAAALLFVPLAGCVDFFPPAEEAPTPTPIIGDAGEELPVGYVADNVFSLNFDSTRSLAPLSTGSTDNMHVGHLVYERLFEVDESFQASSRLVSSFETTDGGTTWLFKINTAVAFHDGSTLTAKDVSYSLQRAQWSGFYRNRLSLIYGVSALDGDTVMITLQYPNLQLPLRLCVPVIKDGSIGDAIPPGTGPYQYSEDLSKLTVFSGHPDAASMPVQEIHLKEYHDAGDFITAFEDSHIDLVTNDPTGRSSLGYGGVNETRYYATNSMHYLGFNGLSHFLCYPEYRYALNFAVDRLYIAQEALGGAATPATLPVSPHSPLYDANLAAAFTYNLDRCLREFAQVSVLDHDRDGKLEYMVTGIPIEIDINFIVCSDSSAKIIAARKIAADLTGLGLTVKLRELNFSEYEQALEKGEFDMYYAEVRLPADFDLMPFVTRGGALNFGGLSSELWETDVRNYLAAADETRQEACLTMCQSVAQFGLIIPICFEKHEIITHRGVVSGMTPTQYNLFHNIKDWTIAFE